MKNKQKKSDEKQYIRLMLGVKSCYANHCFENGFIGLDYGIEEDLKEYICEKRVDFIAKVLPIHRKKRGYQPMRASVMACDTIWRLFRCYPVGTTVLSPDGNGNYHIGVIKGDYEFNHDHNLRHRRKIKWLSQTINRQKTINREKLSKRLKGTTGCPQTCCDITKYKKEIEELADFI